MMGSRARSGDAEGGEAQVMDGQEGPTFGALLRRYRRAAGLTQEELAERALLSPFTISALERGSTQSPRKDTLALLADALRLDPEERTALETAARGGDSGTVLPVALDVSPSVAILIGSAVVPAAAQAAVGDLTARGLRCWLATDVPAPALREGLRACRAVLLLYSAGVGLHREITQALETTALYDRPLITACLGGEGEATVVPLVPAGEGCAIDLRGPLYATALPELAALLTNIMGPEPPPAAGGRLAPAPRNPYKGLRAFRAEDTGDFFGRERLVAQLLEVTERCNQPGAVRFLAVVGPSGSGKSSVVLAGLLPRLRAGLLPDSARWTYLAPLLPGAHPLEALSVALANALPHSALSVIQADLEASARGLHLLASRLVRTPEERIILVVDQAEELFTLTTAEEERRQFIDLLVAAVSEPRGPLLALLTLRADFYDRPLAYPGLGRLLEAHSVLVLPLAVAELRAAVEAPARLPEVDLAFEGDLVGDLLYEVRDQAGALPLLQFTLDQLYERREGHLLTASAYRALGGVRGALAKQAEATYQALPDAAHQALGRVLFLRLIEPGASTQETARRRATVADLELADADQAARLRMVAEAFIGARLLTAGGRGGERTLEVSHEALIREWTRLGDWLEEAREDVRLQGRLSADAGEWDQRGRPQDALYRGTVLQEARAWVERNTPSAREAAFLDAATEEARRQSAAERGRQARELAVARQAATRLRVLAAGLAVFLVAAVGLTTLAVYNATQASEQSRRATAERNVALSRQLAAEAVTRQSGQYDLAILLGLEAQRQSNTVEARASLLQALQAAPPGLIAFLRGHTLVVTALARSPDGTVLASGSSDGTIRLWNLARHAPLGPPLRAGGSGVNSLAFSPDGHTLAAGTFDDTIQLWDVGRRRPRGAPLRVLYDPTNSGGITTLAYSPDGRLLAAGCSCRRAYLWDTVRRQELGDALFAALPGPAGAVAFSPDGQFLAVGTGEGYVFLWKVVSPADLVSSGYLTLGTQAINTLAFNPTGTLLAAASLDHRVYLWDMVRGRTLEPPLGGHTDSVLSLAFSADGATLASGSLDGTVRLWDVRRRRALGPPLLSHSGEVDGVVFSPDGHTLAAATADGSIALWDIWDRRATSPVLNGVVGVVRNRSYLTGSINGVAVSRDGAFLALSRGDSHVEFWDLRTGRPRGSVAAVATVGNLAFSGATHAVVAETDLGVQVWDAATGRAVGEPVSTQGGPLFSLALARDGRTAITGAGDGTLQFWSIAPGPGARLRPLGSPLAAHDGGVRSVAFSPDGRLVASGGGDRLIRLWDTVHRRWVGTPLRGHSGAVNALAFRPDGKVLASASDDATIRLWDVARHTQIGPPLIGHADGVITVAFSPDGSLLASGSADNTVRLWDVATGQPLGPPLTGFVALVASVAFSPDGRTLIAGSWDGTVRAWEVDLRAWPALACRIANRNLSLQEWRQYLGDTPYHQTCPSLPAGS
jgi:WD40 repeat protein/transcriptional regulator with XRE-family HTH domain